LETGKPKSYVDGCYVLSVKVIFLEPKVLYRSAVDEVPVGDYELPLGEADIVRRCLKLCIPFRNNSIILLVVIRYFFLSKVGPTLRWLDGARRFACWKRHAILPKSSALAAN
jgi:hypothetical protein